MMPFIVQHHKHGNVIGISLRPNHSWTRPVPLEFQFTTEAEAHSFIREGLGDEKGTRYSAIDKPYLTQKEHHARQQKKDR